VIGFTPGPVFNLDDKWYKTHNDELVSVVMKLARVVAASGLLIMVNQPEIYDRASNKGERMLSLHVVIPIAPCSVCGGTGISGLPPLGLCQSCWGSRFQAQSEMRKLRTLVWPAIEKAGLELARDMSGGRYGSSC
jgi:hypothetical protein